MLHILSKIEDRFNNISKKIDLSIFFNIMTPTLKVLPTFYTKEYASPFNLVFLQSLSNLDVFSHDEVFLVRDGLCELVKFFIFNPTPPKDSKAILLFPLDFEAFIPAPWKEISVSYSYQEKVPVPRLSVGNELILFGHITFEGLDLDFLRLVVNGISDKTKVFGLFEDQIRYSAIYYTYQSKSMECIHHFFNTIPSKIEHLEERSIYRLGVNQAWQMFDVDVYDFHIYDKWIHHFLRGQGVSSLAGRKISQNENDLKLSLSPFEMIRINTWSASEKDQFKELYLETKLVNLAPENFYRAFGEYLSGLNKSRRSKELKIFSQT